METQSRLTKTQKSFVITCLLLTFIMGLAYFLTPSPGTYQQPADMLPWHTPSPQQHIESITQPRSTSWPTARRHHLAWEPGCAVCDKTEDVNVHHIIPFHIQPKLELVDSNMITLCPDHHFQIGHLWNYRRWNPHVREDAALLRQRIKEADAATKK